MADLVSIEVSGAQQLHDHLRAALARLRRPRELMQALGEVMVTNIELRFAAKRDPAGAAWQPLAASTLRRYARADAKGGGGRRGTILERTGRMRDSLVANAGDDWVEIGMSRLTDGGRWAIPLLHELGTARMPRRGIFFADPQAGRLGAGDERDLDDEIAAFLDDLLGE